MSTIPGKEPPVKLPPQVETPRDLLVQELGKLLTIEETLAKRILPALQKEIQDEQLSTAVSQHLEETRKHVDRVKEAFSALQEEPSGSPALGLDGLRTEREQAVTQIAPALRAGFNCAAAMGTEHYEINAYEAAIRLAEAMGSAEVGDLLRTNLAEEVAALEKLAGHADRLAAQAVEERAVP
jgi:ferritin-like metal-binding protein YciE